MNIVILRAGWVGSLEAESLVYEPNNITAVDTHQPRPPWLQDRLVLHTGSGNAALPSAQLANR